jgi:hypothetical protein
LRRGRDLAKDNLAYQMIEEERLERERAKDAARGGAGKQRPCRS